MMDLFFSEVHRRRLSIEVTTSIFSLIITVIVLAVLLYSFHLKGTQLGLIQSLGIELFLKG